jgi:PAS domain S-box-containing protein
MVSDVLDRSRRAASVVPTTDEVIADLRSRLRRAEEAEQRWRSVIESPFDYVMVLDHNLVIRYINRIGFGYEKEDVIDHSTILDYIAPEFHDEVCRKIRTVFEGGESETYEVHAPPPVDRWYLTLVSPFEVGDEVQSVSLQSRDITLQKEAERELEESQGRFRQLAENIEDCFYLLDVVNSHLLYVSPAVESVMGLVEGELYRNPKSWLSVVHADDRDACERGMQLLGTEAYDYGRAFEYRVRSNGGVRWVQHRAFPVRNDKQAIIRIAGIVTDITERKQAAQQIMAIEARHRRLLETLPIISYIAESGRNHIARYVSPQIEWKLGYTQEEWTSNPALWWERIHPDDLETVRAATEALESTGEPMKVEYRLLSKDGAAITLREEARKVQLGPDDEPLVHGVLLDVSEEVDARVGQRRAQEASAQLVQIQEAERRHLARELHDEVGQSLTLLRMLLESLDDDAQSTRSRKVQQARQHVQELMKKTHDLARDLRPAMLDDLGLEPTLTWLVKRLMEQSGLSVRFEHAGLEGVRYDSDVETAVFRIVQEALTNCVRHAGASTVLVRVWRMEETLNIQVEDDGSGFDPSEAAPHRSGLIGIRERASALGGESEVESVPGEGCRLLVQIPLEWPHAD